MIDLRLNSLAIGYDKQPLVRDISADIKAGVLSIVIGPNGGGKSTFLKTLVGDLEPVSGEILIDGRPLSEISGAERAKMISIVMTSRPRTELLTVRDVVESSRYPYTGFFGILSRKDHEKAEEAMRMTEVLDIAEQQFDILSDGQKTRVMIARAICQEAQLMVLDEPIGYLDINYKLEMIKLLKKIARERNIAVVMSMHELELVRETEGVVICIKKDAGMMMGGFEEIFTEENLRELFSIKGEEFTEYYRRMKSAEI